MVVIKEYSTLESGLKPIKAVPLTPESFAKYGAIISADHQVSQAPKSSANQGTAIKLHKVAPITNKYAECKSQVPATANWNIFRCSPPKHLISEKKDGKFHYTAKVLERHPYSTQTFTPVGRDAKKLGYLVICAPTGEDGMPVYEKAEGFLCNGNQSVTYGLATWHAPMIALGDEQYLDFAVLVHENGVPEEDCEECVYNPGFVIEF